MLTEELLRKFGENGYVVHDISKFEKEIKSFPGGLEGLQNRLNKLKNITDNATFSYHEFEEGLTNYLKRIQSLINIDPLFNFSDLNLIEAFKAKFNYISNKYIVTYKVRNLKEELDKKENELSDVKNSISKLKTNQAVNSFDVISYNKYKNREFLLEIECKKLSNQINHEKENLAFPVENDFDTLKNQVLKEISELIALTNELSLNSQTRLSLSELYIEISDYYNNYGFDAISAGLEFNNLLDRYGISTADKIKSEKKPKIEPESSEKLEPITLNQNNKTPIQIVDRDDAYNEIKAVNELQEKFFDLFNAKQGKIINIVEPKETNQVYVPELGKEEEILEPITISKDKLGNFESNTDTKNTKTPIEIVDRDDYEFTSVSDIFDKTNSFINEFNAQKEEFIPTYEKEDYKDLKDPNTYSNEDYISAKPYSSYPKENFVYNVEKPKTTNSEIFKVSAVAAIAISPKVSSDVNYAAANSLIASTDKLKKTDYSFLTMAITKIKNVFASKGKRINNDENILYQETIKEVKDEIKQEEHGLDIDMDAINKVIDEIQEENMKKGKVL